MNRNGWLLIIVLLLYGCNGGTQPEQSQGVQDKTAQNQIVINYGRQVAAAKENLTLKFVVILEDSRCPEGVQCIWAGNARIELAVTRAGEDTTSLELNTNDRYPVEAQYLDYTITLIDLKPYPKAAEQIDIENYTATIEIQKP
jgi:hypothetical protein